LSGGALLLVTMIGSKSGKERTVPLGYAATEGRLFVVASRGGTDVNPVWYDNLRANPMVTVECGPETFRAEAVVLEGAERDRIFDVAKKQVPDYAEYEKRTTRKIPVVELRRLS
jgi:deazaflavin-dependent oxidoreductase (nitroreductase family)